MWHAASIDTVLIPKSSVPKIDLMISLGALVSEASSSIPNIVDLAKSDADLSTLVAALAAGRLVSALEARGPFTVFAPSNGAFAKLPKATLMQLLKEPAQLDKILEYHVVPGRYDAASIISRGSGELTTLEGQQVSFSTATGSVVVNGNSHVIKANLEASNGVVHVIDTDLMPTAL